MNTHIKEGLGDRIFNGVTLILILLIIVVVAYPLYFVLVASMSSPTAVNSGKILLYPDGFSLIGYQNILQNTKLWSGYANTIFYTVAGTFLGVCCTIMAGYAFSRTDLPGRNLLMGLFVFTMYFSGGLIPTYMVIKALGLIDNFLVFIFPGLINIYWMILVRTYIEGLPAELFEAAASEGAGEFTIFLKVVLPLSMPVLATILLFSAISHWNAWYDSYIYTYKPQLKTLQAVLVKILNQYQTGAMVSQAQQMANEAKKMPVSSESIRMTVTMVATIPIILVYPFLQKYFIKGMLLGAVKD